MIPGPSANISDADVWIVDEGDGWVQQIATRLLDQPVLVIESGLFPVWSIVSRGEDKKQEHFCCFSLQKRSSITLDVLALGYMRSRLVVNKG